MVSAKVKVFILAGQSNMHGRGKIYHLQRLQEQGEFSYLANRDGTLASRDDVRITTEQRRGDSSDLVFGYGIPVVVSLGIDGKFGPGKSLLLSFAEKSVILLLSTSDPVH